MRKISDQPGFDPWNVQRLASRDTDRAIVKVQRLRGGARNCVQSVRCDGWGFQAAVGTIQHGPGLLGWKGMGLLHGVVTWGCYVGLLHGVVT